MKRKFDITCNAMWTNAYCGIMDLDFSILEAATRYWTDCTAKCYILLLNDYNYDVGEHVKGGIEPITIISSDYIAGDTKEECQMKVRQWYNDHIFEAMIKAIIILKGWRDKSNIDNIKYRL